MCFSKITKISNFVILEKRNYHIVESFRHKTKKLFDIFKLQSATKDKVHNSLEYNISVLKGASEISIYKFYCI